MWFWLVFQSIFVIGFTVRLFIETPNPAIIFCWLVSIAVLAWIIYRIIHPRSEARKKQRRYEQEQRTILRERKRLKKEIRDCQKKHELD